MITLHLPWPDKLLSPNIRTHWSKKAAAARTQKLIARMEVGKYWATFNEDKTKRYAIHLVFAPPSRRRMDLDNRIASCKHMLDGIAMGLGVDDSTFKLSAEMLTDIVKGGEVRVMIREAT